MYPVCRHRLKSGVKGLWVFEKRGDVLEHNPWLRIVRDVPDVGTQIHEYSFVSERPCRYCDTRKCTSTIHTTRPAQGRAGELALSLTLSDDFLTYLRTFTFDG